MRFNELRPILRAFRIETRLLVNAVYQIPLRGSAWHCDSWRCSIRVHTRLPNDSFDSVIVCKGLTERFEDDSSYAFTSRITIGILIPHPTKTVGGEHLQLAFDDIHFRAKDEIGPTCYRCVTVSRPKCLDSLMDSDQT